MKPFVKWAGGKRQILPFIIDSIRTFSKVTGDNYTFYEPFVGGGAVFIKLQHKNVVINDTNTELMNCYRVIKENPMELMKSLDEHKINYGDGNHDYYYKIRSQDRSDEYENFSTVEKASRMIFLNKTCYNGLYRVNSMGFFNTPAGRYNKPSIYDQKNIALLSKYFKNSSLTIMNTDYSETLVNVKNGDIIYVDPPYDYGGEVGFTNYQKEGFTFNDFKKMKEHLDICVDRGAYVIISNNATNRVIRLFQEDSRYRIHYDMQTLKTRRNINSNGENRDSGFEVIIMGIPTTFPQADSLQKITKLIRVNDENTINDTEKLKKLLGVTTYRQVQYYIMALRYLGVITHDKKFSELGVRLRMLTTQKFQIELANIILNLEIFKFIYQEENKRGVFLSEKEISYLLKNKVPGYSESTYNRRTKTIKKWLEFCRSALEELKKV